MDNNLIEDCVESTDQISDLYDRICDADSSTIVAILERITHRTNEDSSVYKGYSGKGMFGAECYGIRCQNPLEVVEIAASMGLRGASMDSLGLGSVVYW